jgi:N6-adenosine-specific RNA methylase IME4
MSSTELALFSVAKEALAEAVKVDEVKDVRDHAERIRLYGQQANDRTIIADATEIIMRAERRLGELLRSAHETGQLGIGRPTRSNLDEGEEAPEEEAETVEVVRPQRVTLKEAGISKKLSTRSQKFAAVAETAFEAALLSAREKILAGGAVVVNPLKDLSTAEKKSRRRAREIELGAKQMALPEARFGVIYADPEWKFEAYSDETGMDRAADNHYPTSALEAIKSRDVGSLAADDCVLFLWATVPMLPQALEVMAAWGFAYKSNFDWRKDQIGTGYWNRNRHEHLLIGTRGKIPAPAMGEQFDSSIEAPVGVHSAKPEKFYEIIEAYFPTLPKIELNARVARPGWVRWGYEAPEQDQASDGRRLTAVTENVAPIHQVTSDAQFRDPLDWEDEDGAAPISEPAPLTPDQIDDILRACDAEKASLANQMQRTGLTRDQVKKRRKKLGIASRDRQREAVAEANRRRAAK